MCLILLAYGVHPEYRLVAGANRDEFHERPTAPAAFWADAPTVLAGRDLRAGGTWMGVTRGGRFAAITNYREPGAQNAGAPSRGELVSAFLRGWAAPAEYLSGVAARAAEFNGFNLLVGDWERLLYYSNRAGAAPRELPPGVYGLSNALLDTPWPKVERGKRELAAVLADRTGPSAESVFRVLADRTEADDASLPATGVGAGLERILSPRFITGAQYGTRSSTVLLAGYDGNVAFTERTFAAGPEQSGDVRFEFALEPQSPLTAASGSARGRRGARTA